METFKVNVRKSRVIVTLLPTGEQRQMICPDNQSAHRKAGVLRSVDNELIRMETSIANNINNEVWSKV